MKYLRHPRSIALLLGLLVCLVLAALRFIGTMQALEIRAYDWLLPLRAVQNSESRIVVIGESEADVRRYGHPLPDETFAMVLDKLLGLGARVVGVDKYRDMSVAPGTKRFNKLLRSKDNLIWIFFVGNQSQERIAPPAVLQGSGRIGFNDIVADPDGILRRGLLFLDENGATHTSFPLLLTLNYLAGENIQAESAEQGYLRLGKNTLLPLQPNSGGYANIDAGGYQFMLDYPHLGQSFPTYALSDLLDGKVAADRIRDKLVLVGAMASSLGDYVMLPSGEHHYGVELHAYAIDQLLQTAINGRPLMRDWSEPAEYAWLLLWCLIGGLASLWRGSLFRQFLISTGGMAVLLIGAGLLFQRGWWVPLVPPAVGWLASQALGSTWFSVQERAERRQLFQMFERYVSPQVVTALWETRDAFFTQSGVRPDQLTATVLFTDLAGFTTVAEAMEPMVLMGWLNDYMEEMSAILIEQGGMINKYIGDAIMAVFGAPVKRYDEAGINADALNAVESAVRMGERLNELNQRWRLAGLPVMGMRIGIYTGSLVAGTLGGRQRMEYTVIGDTVNIASRLESYDKTMAVPDKTNPCRILLGESTWQRIRSHYLTEEVGACQLKGKHNSLKIYRIIGRILH